ncbi:MAG TPA: entericidin A/B family lipoprotein [Paenirhodobacter sp.]
MRKVLIPAMLLLALAACETVKGAGEDIQTGGAAVSREAAHAKAKM